MIGRRKNAITTTGLTNATACAGITRRLSGARRKKWDARWREAAGARCGCANTIRREIGWVSGRIERSVLGGQALQVVDDHDGHGVLLRVQLEAELLVDGFEKCETARWRPCDPGRCTASVRAR